MRSIMGAALVASVAIANAAFAQPTSPSANLAVMTLGYTYFNLPCANPQTHNDAVLACVTQAAKTRSSFDDQSLSPSGVTGLLGYAIENAEQTAFHHGVVGANLENCMVARGWRVVLLPDAEGKELADLPQSDLAARLAPWIGAPTPHGEIVRVWRNDAAMDGTNRFAFQPAHNNKGQLSLLSATGHDLTQFTIQPDTFASIYAHDYYKTLDPRWLQRTMGARLKPGDLATVSPEGGVLIGEVRNGTMYGATWVLFSREGVKPDDIASISDHRLDYILLGVPTIFGNRTPTMLAEAVPPGRWRIAGVGSNALGTLQFCLGSPAFDVKAGDVIYVGSFDLAKDFGPKMDLAPVKAWLAGTPQAGMVKAAAYTNGSTGPCGGADIYAFEIPGAPIEPGNAGGAAAAVGQAPEPVAR